jgi:hypothetical protein
LHEDKRKALELLPARVDPQLAAEMEAALDRYQRSLTR